MSIERLPLVSEEISSKRESMEDEEVTSRANVEIPAELRSFMCEVERAVAKTRKEPLPCRARASAEPREASEQPVMSTVRVEETMMAIKTVLTL